MRYLITICLLTSTPDYLKKKMKERKRTPTIVDNMYMSEPLSFVHLHPRTSWTTSKIKGLKFPSPHTYIKQTITVIACCNMHS